MMMSWTIWSFAWTIEPPSIVTPALIASFSRMTLAQSIRVTLPLNVMFSRVRLDTPWRTTGPRMNVVALGEPRMDTPLSVLVRVKPP